ncbi:DUF732 domain-containing protein [Mycolicibacterium elephantis]
MNYCVFCGTALSDPARCGQCGAYKVGSSWQQVSPTVESSSTVPETGWRPDPTGRHEGRYFVGGHPTDLIRDGDVESVDPIGKQQLEDASAVRASAPPTARRPRRRRLWWSVFGVVVVLMLAGVGVGVALYVNRDKETVDDRYLADLRQSGLAGEFNSDANAIAHGRQVCRQLEDGAKQQGMPVDEVAVAHYCPHFSEGYHILETITVTGSISLKDESPNYYYPAIVVSGATCSGAGGYSDIDAGAQVTVKNGKGDILTTTFLEPGKGGRYMCTFAFSFEITEGEDRYVVSLGRRGDMGYSFADLKSNGVTLTLG